MENNDLVLEHAAVGSISVKGLTMLFDVRDAQFIESRKWQVFFNKSGRPHVRDGHGLLTRQLLSAPEGLHVDHINGNTLDNRRCNLRICTHAENQWNRKHGYGATRFKGVALLSDPRAVSRWRATVQRSGRRYTIGTFKTALAAALAYDAAAVQLFGEFAAPNFPERFKHLVRSEMRA